MKLQLFKSERIIRTDLERINKFSRENEKFPVSEYGCIEKIG